MRSVHLAFGAITLALSIGCGSEPAAKADAEAKTAANVEGAAKTKAKANAQGEAEAKGDAEVEADAEIEAEADVDIQPRIGGTVVAAGDYHVELLAFVDGRIEAIVMDAKGGLVADMSALAIAATLAAEGDANAKVELAWDAGMQRFVGVVRGGVQLVPGEAKVEVTADGEANVGMLAQLGLAVQAGHGGQVMVAGDHSIEIAASAGFVHAYVFDVAGKAHAAGDLDIEMQVDGGAALDLKWDPPSASYTAEWKGDLDLEAKPVVVKVEVAGAAAIAAVASFHASAAVATRGELDAEVEVRPPKAKIDASAKGNASAKGGAKVETKKSASAGGKASAKAGGGSAKAGVSGKAKAKASFGF
jgi:hypothetical protein